MAALLEHIFSDCGSCFLSSRSGTLWERMIYAKYNDFSVDCSGQGHQLNGIWQTLLRNVRESCLHQQCTYFAERIVSIPSYNQRFRIEAGLISAYFRSHESWTGRVKQNCRTNVPHQRVFRSSYYTDGGEQTFSGMRADRIVLYAQAFIIPS